MIGGEMKEHPERRNGPVIDGTIPEREDEDSQFFVRMFKHDFEDDPGWMAPPQPARVGILISHDRWGRDEEGFGRELVSDFLTALLDREKRPEIIILVNRAVHLGIRDSDCLELLQKIEAQGVRILVSERSLFHWKVPTELRVGQAVSMSEIVDAFYDLDKVISI